MQDLDDIDTYDSSVVNCLQDYSAEIKSEQCKSQVNKYVKLASQVRDPAAYSIHPQVVVYI